MKIKHSILMVVWFCVLAIAGVFAGVWTISAPTGVLSLDIVWMWVRHWTPNNLNLWTVLYSNQEQEITWQFGSGFWVEDLIGMLTWHYTTIQCDWLHGPSWTSITWIYIKAWNINPTLVLWSTWWVYIPNNLNIFQSIYKPLVYIYKSIGISQVWVINRYQDIPIIKVVVPAYTTAGTYNGIIAFTLYME